MPQRKPGESASKRREKKMRVLKSIDDKKKQKAESDPQKRS